MWRYAALGSAGLTTAFAVLWIAASLADPGMSISWIHEKPNLVLYRPDCEAMRLKAAGLGPLAHVCERDSDCVHYPCSCSAISVNSAGTEYKQLMRELFEACGDSLVFDYCGNTRPVCENARCTVVAEARRPSRPIMAAY